MDYQDHYQLILLVFLYAKEYGVPVSEILTTYVCKKCGDFQVKPYNGEDKDCPLCGSSKSQVTTSVGFGITEEQLNKVYNLMDVYCHPFTSGGQEIPIQEAKLTELITLVTDYSCGEESCEEGSGSIPLNWTEYREHQTEFRKASTCPISIASSIDSVYEMSKEERKKQGELSRKWAIDNFSVEVIGKKFEEFIDSNPASGYDFSDEDPNSKKPNYPDAFVPHIESDSEWVLALYKKILNLDNHVNDEGYKTWMNSLANKVPRSQVEDYFRKVAREHNAKYFPMKIEDYLDKEDKGKRILYVMPDSPVDVFLSTALFKSIKIKYPEYNLYVATKPENFSILLANENVHATIPYTPQFDNPLHLEGVNDEGGYFEIAFTPHLSTQRISNYIHNDKDIINKQDLCTF